MEATNLSEVLPIDEFFDGGFVTTYGDIVFGLEVALPPAFSLSEDAHVQLNEGLAKAMCELGFNVIFQKLDYFYTYEFQSDYKGDNQLIKWDMESFSGKPLVGMNTEIFVCFPLDSKLINGYKNALSGIKSIAMRRPKDLEGKRSEAAYKFHNFVNAVSLLGFKVREMDQSRLKTSIRRYLSGDYKSDSPTIDDIAIDKDGVRVANEYVGVLSAYKYPSDFFLMESSRRRILDGREYNAKSYYRNNCDLPSSFLFPIGLALPFKHCIVQTVKILDNESVLRSFTRGNFYANPFRTFKIGTGLSVKERAIETFKEAIEKDGYLSCDFALDVIVFGKDRDELGKYVRDIKAIASQNLDLSFMQQNVGSGTTFWNCIPGCKRASKNWNKSFVELSVDMFHLEGPFQGDVEGIPMQDIFGNPFWFDDVSKDHAEAFHWWCGAPTRSGKSVFLNKKANAGLSRGHHVIIIDAGKKAGSSYKGLVEFHEGVLLDANDLNNFKGNPFLECPKLENGKYQLDSKKVDRGAGEIDSVVSFFEYLKAIVISSWYYSEDTPKKETDTLIMKSLKAFYESINNGSKREVSYDGWYNYVIDDWYESQENIPEKHFDLYSFKTVCEDFTKKGSYSEIMNSTDIRDLLHERLICYDLEPLKAQPKLGSVILPMALYQVKRKIMMGDGSHVQAIMDESEPFLHGTSGEYVADMFAKIAADNASIGVVTQSITQHLALNKRIHNKILKNIFTRYILDHSKSAPNDIPIMCENLGMTDSGVRQMLESMGSAFADKNEYRLMALVQDGRYILARNYLSPQGFALFNSDSTKRIEINEEVKRHGSIKKGIDAWLKKQMK